VNREIEPIEPVASLARTPRIEDAAQDAARDATDEPNSENT
jgi:hypothetical protein